MIVGDGSSNSRLRPQSRRATEALSTDHCCGVVVIIEERRGRMPFWSWNFFEVVGRPRHANDETDINIGNKLFHTT